MSSRKHGLSGIYPQKKKATPAPGKGKRFSAAEEGSAIGSASLGSRATQPAALVTSKGGQLDLSENYNHVENLLRQFDMNMAFGPCLGMSRSERWERASRLGLNPPFDVRELLVELNASSDCLWEGLV